MAGTGDMRDGACSLDVMATAPVCPARMTSCPTEVEALLTKYHRRHDAWMAGKVCRVAPARLAVLPSRAAQLASHPDITPPFEIHGLGTPCLSAGLRSVGSTDSQSAFADDPVAREQTGRVTTVIPGQ